MIHLLLLTQNVETEYRLTSILDSENLTTTTTSVPSIDQALFQMSQNQFDIVVFETASNGSNHLELLQILKMQHPSIPVLMLSIDNSRAGAIQAMRRNAHGYLTSERIGSELADAVKTIQMGRCYMTTALTA
jgi:two-component system, NarL family, invasion response regulator UvrY